MGRRSKQFLQHKYGLLQSDRMLMLCHIHRYPRILVLLFGLVCTFACSVAEPGVSFEFSSFHPGVENVNVYGDAEPTAKGLLQLTLSAEEANLEGSVGRAVYGEPIRLMDPSTNVTASFNTSFTFRIHTISSEFFGDGLTFMLLPNLSAPSPLSAGEFLGLFDPTEQTQNTVAIEFDTYQNDYDINSNHVGVDIENIISVKAESLSNVGVDLRSGKNISAWIDYDGRLKLLEIYASYNTVKPHERPLLSYRIDLSHFINEYMYVGFSAATGSYAELHAVISWKFNCSHLPNEEVPRPPPPAAVLGITAAPEEAGRKATLGQGYMLWLLVAASVVGILCVILPTIAYVYYITRKGGACRRESLKLRGSDFMLGTALFSYKELSAATNGFNLKALLGQGGFGRVYKGVLPRDGALVAVKRVSQDSQQGEREFSSEVNTIGRLRHRNLVRLQGWCHQEGELLLVYDYMPNGSLDRMLFYPEEKGLSWRQRHLIVCGLAAGLKYLHEDWDQQVVHRDVKASNVMLDGKFNARLGDFGLARLVEHNQNPKTTLVAGTMGYLAPEVSQTGRYTTRSDVFSFGAVVLEVACGRRTIDRLRPPREVVLVEWVWELRKEGRIMDAADPRLGGDYDSEEMERLLLLGLVSSHPDPDSRPTMNQIVQILHGTVPFPSLPLSRPIAFYGPQLPPLITIHNIQDVCS
ncbi:hypothetical protein O6H91_15G019000 [Diphasiastrum complanatum]|uniref:Uncharacterized protein n=1 Tax=Diphasiastrum complanatum TaxID=34168 RepID=A0ACC2BGE8_DIPCM|nr:hypothetical protein O6H91_Y106400 [Diphasiastrum complanatum]KAJ7528772.1 hypothetical protein O6H91_15G019000 [Diphasiastrum complanatum]